jgi:hypothetical protein
MCSLYVTEHRLLMLNMKAMLCNNERQNSVKEIILSSNFVSRIS